MDNPSCPLYHKDQASWECRSKRLIRHKDSWAEKILRQPAPGPYKVWAVWVNLRISAFETWYLVNQSQNNVRYRIPTLHCVFYFATANG